MRDVLKLLCSTVLCGCATSSDAAIGLVSNPTLTANPAQMVRTATFVVAAADSPAHLKAHADVVCPGTNDHVVINSAIAALPEQGGRVHLCAGTFSIGGVEGTRGGINILRSNVLLTGEGSGTRLVLQGGLTDVNVIWIQGDICDITVRDLYINGNGKNQHIIQRWEGSNGIKVIEKVPLDRAPRNILVENCHIENCALMAIMLHGDMAEVVNCYFTGDFGSHVIELLDASGRIEGCTMRVRKGDVVNMGWATDRCFDFQIINNKLFVDEGGEIQANPFQNWPPMYQMVESEKARPFHGIIKGNIFINKGKVGGHIRLAGYLDIISNNIIRDIPIKIGVQMQDRYNGGMWVNFEHNMLVNSPLTIDSPYTDAEYFTFINGNGFINSPVTHENGNVVWGKNPGYVTENYGTATLTSGQISVVVDHGLVATPASVHVTPANNLGAARKFWVEAINNQSFTIKVDVDPGAAAVFNWQATTTGKQTRRESAP